MAASPYPAYGKRGGSILTVEAGVSPDGGFALSGHGKRGGSILTVEAEVSPDGGFALFGMQGMV